MDQPYCHNILFSIISLKTLTRNGLPKYSEIKYFLLLFFVIALPAVTLRLSYINALSVWLDEYIQVTNQSSPFVESAMQQQPPFIYQMTTKIIEVLGFTEFWLRSTSVLFGVLVIFAGGLLGLILNLQKSLLAALMVFLAVTPVLVRYSFEGRPNIAGVFACLIWMCALSLTLIRKDTPKSDFFRTLIATYLFCSTIGMQPLALLLYSIPLLLVHQMYSKNNHWKRTIVSQILALALFLPVLIGIIIESYPLHQFQNVDTWMDRAFDFSETNWLHDGLNIFKMVPFFDLIVLFMTVTMVLIWFKKINFKNILFTLTMLLSFLILPIVYTYIFHVTINWSFFERYFMCYVVLFITYFFFLLDLAIKNWKIKMLPEGKLIILITSLLITTGFSWHIKENLNLTTAPYFTSRSYIPDIRKVYQLINSNEKKPALAANFITGNTLSFELNFLISAEFYTDKSTLENLIYRPYGKGASYGNGDQTFYTVNEIFKNDPKVVFLVMSPIAITKNQQFYDEDLPETIKFYPLKGYQLLKIHDKPSRPLISSLIDYFESWKNSHDRWSQSFRIREFLYYLYAFSKDIESAQPHYDWMLSTDFDNNRIIKGKLKLLKRKHAQLLNGLELIE